MDQKTLSGKMAGSIAAFYETHGHAFAATRHSRWGVFNIVAEHVQPGQTLIDVGAGNARLATALPEDVRYIAIEPSSTLREDAAKMIATRSRAKVRSGGFGEAPLPAADGEADVVACLATLHHVPTAKVRREAVQEMARILKPGGYLVLTV